jgi:hypothetical protein
MKRQKPPVMARPVGAAIIGSIHRFSSARRNSVRGTVAEARRGALGTSKVDSIRANQTEDDMVAAAMVLEAPGGLRNRKVIKLLQSDIAPVHPFKAYTGTLEAAYACGFLNAWKGQALTAVETISLLSRLTEVSSADAISALRKAAEAWGASSYLASKIVYAGEFFGLDDEERQGLAAISDMIGHSADPTLQYVLLENFKTAFSVFMVARRRTNIFNEHVKGDFRRFYSLSDLVATPVSENDCGPFLLRAVCSSLIDTVRALWIIVNLKDRLPGVYLAIANSLDPDILDLLTSRQAEVAALDQPDLLLTAEPLSDDSSSENSRSLLLWKRSAAFLEFKYLCNYRNDIDCVVGFRLVAPLLPEITHWTGETFENLEILKKPDGNFELAKHGSEDVALDTFYRTYLFLRFIQDPMNLSLLSSKDVQQIFDNTMRLESLFLERELKTLHLNASDEARALISVLALSLYRSKSSAWHLLVRRSQITFSRHLTR